MKIFAVATKWRLDYNISATYNQVADETHQSRPDTLYTLILKISNVIFKLMVNSQSFVEDFSTSWMYRRKKSPFRLEPMVSMKDQIVDNECTTFDQKKCWKLFFQWFFLSLNTIIQTFSSAQISLISVYELTTLAWILSGISTVKYQSYGFFSLQFQLKWKCSPRLSKPTYFYATPVIDWIHWNECIA